MAIKAIKWNFTTAIKGAKRVESNIKILELRRYLIPRKGGTGFTNEKKKFIPCSLSIKKLKLIISGN